MADTQRTFDPILDELHAVRRKMHDDCGGDLSKLVAQMRKRQESSGHPIAPIPVPGHRAAEECTKAADNAVSDGENV